MHFDAIYEIELMYTYIWNNSILIHLNIFFYQMIMMLKSGTAQNFIITTVDNHVTCGQCINRMLQRILVENQ